MQKMQSFVKHAKYSPVGDLANYVEHVWAIRADMGQSVAREILVPSGRPGFVFCLGQPCVRTDVKSGKIYQEGTVYYSAATHPFKLDQSGLTWYVGVELKSYGLAAFTQNKITANAVRPLNELFDANSLEALLSDLRHQGSSSLAAKLVFDFLARRVDKLPGADMQRLDAAMQIIQQCNGDIATIEVARRLRISASTLRRLFGRYIGISPEQFINIMRYELFTKDVLKSPYASAFLAATHGYYDQAHATKTFKKYTGLNKTDFLYMHDNLARIMYE